MIKAYLKRELNVAMQRKFPKHPLVCRTVVKGDDIVSVDSEDDVPSDQHVINYVPFSTYVQTGEVPPKMGGFNSANTRLTEQRVAEIFLEQFGQLERMKQMKSEPAPAPAVEPQISTTNAE